MPAKKYATDRERLDARNRQLALTRKLPADWVVCANPACGMRWQRNRMQCTDDVRYHSRACAQQHLHTKRSPDAWRQMALIASRRAVQVRRANAIKRAQADIQTVLNADRRFRDLFPEDRVAVMEVLIPRVWKRAYAAGYDKGWEARRAAKTTAA